MQTIIFFNFFFTIVSLYMWYVWPNFLSKQSRIAISITSQIMVTEEEKELLLGCEMTLSDIYL